jgi:hypothetical protein
MYAALWRVLPGPVWVKIVELVVLVIAVSVVLIACVFPVIADFVFVEESTLGQK